MRNKTLDIPCVVNSGMLEFLLVHYQCAFILYLYSTLHKLRIVTGDSLSHPVPQLLPEILTDSILHGATLSHIGLSPAVLFMKIMWTASTFKGSRQNSILYLRYCQGYSLLLPTVSTSDWLSINCAELTNKQLWDLCGFQNIVSLLSVMMHNLSNWGRRVKFCTHLDCKSRRWIPKI